MRFVITVFFLLFSLLCFSQIVTSTDLIGTWTVKEVIVSKTDLDEDQMMILQMMKDGFQKSIYQFLADGTFKFSYEDDVAEIMSELAFLNNTQWKYDQSTATIAIGAEADKFSLTSIEIIIIEDTNFFQIAESPFVMHMLKSSQP